MTPDDLAAIRKRLGRKPAYPTGGAEHVLRLLNEARRDVRALLEEVERLQGQPGSRGAETEDADC